MEQRKEIIEIPFGAKDSELKGWEYAIPENMEAEIKDGKIIVKQMGSEDERIRNCITTVIKIQKRGSFGLECNHGATWDEMLAYLERQKVIVMHTPRYAPPEQKPADKCKGCNNFKGCINCVDGSEWAHIEEIKQKLAMIQWTGSNLKEVIDFTGKSHKFNEWFKSWDDFENYVHTHNDILKLFCDDGSHYEVPVGAWIVKTPDGFNIPSLFRFVQKPAKESEKPIIPECSEEEIVNWLKENFYVSSFDNTKIVTKFSSMYDLIKSVRERLKSLRPSWKPSEEQMEALSDAWLACDDKEKCELLSSLYDDLKKL